MADILKAHEPEPEPEPEVFFDLTLGGRCLGLFGIMLQQVALFLCNYLFLYPGVRDLFQELSQDIV